VLKLFAFTFAARCINLLLLCTKVHKSAQRCFNDAKDKKSKAKMEIKTKTKAFQAPHLFLPRGKKTLKCSERKKLPIQIKPKLIAGWRKIDLNKTSFCFEMLLAN